MELSAIARQSRIEKRRSKLKILFPKEHGAWGTLFVPFLVSIAVAGKWHFAELTLLGAIFFMFLVRYPLVVWARSRFKSFPPGSKATLVVAGAHGSFLVALLLFKYQLWLLLPLGLAGFLLLAVHLMMVMRRTERTVAGELLGVLALTSSATAAHYAATGTLSTIAWLLWLLCALFFGSSVFFVKIQVARRHPAKVDRSVSTLVRALAIYLAAALGSVLLLSYLGSLPPLTVVAFLPSTVWMLAVIVRESAASSIRKLGFTLVAHSIVFGVVLTLAFLPRGGI